MCRVDNRTGYPGEDQLGQAEGPTLRGVCFDDYISLQSVSVRESDFVGRLGRNAGRRMHEWIYFFGALIA